MTKRKWYVIIIVVLLILIGIGSKYAYDEYHKQQVLESLQMTFQEDRSIEYGENVEAKDFVKEAKGNIVSSSKIDTKKLGEQTITYVLEKEELKKEFTLKVTVKDTKKPIITLKKEKLSIEEGQSLDVKKNIVSVKDVVDGKLTMQKANRELEKGHYQIKEDLDTKKPGKYTVEVIAKDSNGNVSKKEFVVTVTKKKVVKVEEPKQPEVEVQPQIEQKPVKPNKPQHETIQPTYINGILLVNRTHPLPSTYGGTDPVAYQALQQLQAAASKAGYSLPLLSGYRSYQYQVELYNMYVERDGQAAADRYSARPGTSEHQSGLAFDIGKIDNNFGNTKTGKWLDKHCAEYGFIIRFPQGKEHITGYMYEPWHVRYVGVEHATYIMQNNLCLEEYLNAY